MPAPIPPELHPLMETTAQMLNRVLDPDTGFVVVAFRQDDLGERMHVLSNCTDALVIAALRELTIKLEVMELAERKVVAFTKKERA